MQLLRQHHRHTHEPYTLGGPLARKARERVHSLPDVMMQGVSDSTVESRVWSWASNEPLIMSGCWRNSSLARSTRKSRSRMLAG